MNSLPSLNDAISYVRKNPHLFLSYSSTGVRAEEIASKIIFDAMIQGADRLDIKKIGNWISIASDINCWDFGEKYSIRDLFEKIIPFPEGGANACRSEILVGAFSDSFAVVSDELIVHDRRGILWDDSLIKHATTHSRCRFFLTFIV